MRVFSWIGLTGFGGPAAHLAMMEEEFVQRRRWISSQDFIDFVGATNLIPGPNAPEMAAHIGQRQAGWRGMVACGVSFITPGILLTLAIAWAYVRYGTMPQAEAMLGGIKPVVLAVVAMATYRLGRVAVRTLPCFALAGVSLALGMYGVDEIPLLFGMGIAGMLLLRLLDASSPPDDHLPPIAQGTAEPGTDCVKPLRQMPQGENANPAISFCGAPCVPCRCAIRAWSVGVYAKRGAVKIRTRQFWRSCCARKRGSIICPGWKRFWTLQVMASSSSIERITLFILTSHVNV